MWTAVHSLTRSGVHDDLEQASGGYPSQRKHPHTDRQLQKERNSRFYLDFDIVQCEKERLAPRSKLTVDEHNSVYKVNGFRGVAKSIEPVLVLIIFGENI